MKRRQKSKIEKPKFTLTIGRIYLVTRYYTGDFRAKCCDSRIRTVKLKVTDPMRSELQVDDELEIPFVHAEFLPVLIEQMNRPIEERGGAYA